MANPLQQSLNRRGFLAGVAGAAAGGVSLLSCDAAKPTVEAAPLKVTSCPTFIPQVAGG